MNKVLDLLKFKMLWATSGIIISIKNIILGILPFKLIISEERSKPTPNATGSGELEERAVWIWWRNTGAKASSRGPSQLHCPQTPDVFQHRNYICTIQHTVIVLGASLEINIMFALSLSCNCPWMTSPSISFNSLLPSSCYLFQCPSHDFILPWTSMFFPLPILISTYHHSQHELLRYTS